MSWALLVSWGLKSTMVLGTAFLATWLLKRSPAAVRHWIWTLCLAGLLALPALEWLSLRAEIPAVAIPAPVRIAVQGHAASPVAPGWRTRTASLWWAGALLLAIRFTIAHALAIRLARRASPAGGFRVSSEIRIPMTCGILRPVILLPEEASRWPDQRRQAVLLHEQGHVKRCDTLTHLVAQAACSLYWFQPLAWIALRRMGAERERACDDLALGAGWRPSDYASHLVELARTLSFRERCYTPAVAMAAPSQLEARVRAILTQGTRRNPLCVKAAFLAALAAAVLIVPVAALRAWQGATVSGAVTDESRARVPGAEVILRAASGAVQSTRTGAAGEFSFHGLEPGLFTLEVRAQGFAEAAVRGIDLGPGARRTVFPRLSLGEVVQRVDVVAGRLPAAGAVAAPVPIRVGGHVESARLITRVPPSYPAEALALGVEGVVGLRGVIRADGTLGNLEVVDAPHPSLGEAAREAVSQWRYQPSRLNGNPVGIITTISIDFRLEAQ